jgi:Mg2+-importing ATPase
MGIDTPQQPGGPVSEDSTDRYWALPIDALLSALAARTEGLTTAEASERLRRLGPNALPHEARWGWLRLLLSRFTTPLVLILIVAALISLTIGDWPDAATVLGIVLITAVLGFLQEYRASVAVDALRKSVALKASVLRDGTLVSIAAADVVPGDVVELSAGSLVPADARVLEARDCFVNQALLTGETLPVEKQPAVCAADASLPQRDNCVFRGTSLRSGWARALVVRTGRATLYGEIADRLVLRPPETEFERGLRRFGGLLIGLMLTVVVVVLAANMFLHRPVIDTLLFAAALAVGLSPELLPAILTITLSHGARAMARRGVIVKRLSAIENLGSMDTLCTDKTGTLTRGVVTLDTASDLAGQDDHAVLRLAWLNASLQTGIRNPLDDAIIARGQRDEIARGDATKVDEIPYDFLRRRLSVVVTTGGEPSTLLITKGAVENVLETCTLARKGGQDVPLDAALRDDVMQRLASSGQQGFRVLALATRTLPRKARYSRDDEQQMTFVGFLFFFDPPEPQVATTLAGLRGLGVDVKIITGDNRFVSRHVADAIGMPVAGTLTGGELQRLPDEALWHLAPSITLFTEIDPNQKERIIVALQKTGHVVGYLGDGINDAPALHAADVGISVDSAVDVAREAADFVLLRHDLDVLRQGIDEGRHTFANTLKYIFITISANFGNMISMAAASLFLPFLPLLAKQILLNNFLSDLPAMGIAADNVDREWERTPHRWDIGLIRRAMLTFGLTSTVFDMLTFAALLGLAGENRDIFRTGWFLESLLTEIWILFVIRTYRPFYRSPPGRLLLWSGIATMAVALALPLLPIAAVFGLVPLPPRIVVAIIAITGLYVVVSEATKRIFYRRMDPGRRDAR